MNKIPLGKGRKIFVSGPYRAKTEEEKRDNIWHAVRVAVRLWELGWCVFCPHANTANFDLFSSLPPKAYLEGDIAFLKECSAIFMLEGWEQSVGAKRELEVATEQSLEVYYEKETLPGLS